MCGICGFAGLPPDAARLGRMTASFAHRGPDGEGRLERDEIGLAVRRLSVIDLEGGNQPLFNEDRTVAVVLNGEIYNYRAIREDLGRRGHSLATRSDTEILAHLFEDEGIEMVHRLRGMFAFAIYDLRDRSLYLARDRIGLKPLYYWTHGRSLVFASEIKALLEGHEIPRRPNLAAIDAYLSLRYVPGPGTIFDGIGKLPAGHWLRWKDGTVERRRYWTADYRDSEERDDEITYERFKRVFEETTRLHLESDVPVGAFLSGGVDSTAIVATVQRFTGKPVKTFSVGFDWPGDELPVARQVAARLGCEHHEILCRPEDMALLPRIVWHLDEPIGDAIVLPMYLLSRLARQHVKVVLSGEGADEIFAGYLFHKVLYWAAQYRRRVPRILRRAAVLPLLKRIPSALLTKAFAYPAALGERGKAKLIDFVEGLDETSTEQQFHFLISLMDRRDKKGLYTGEMRRALDVEAPDGAGEKLPGNLHRILRVQYDHWLPDDILMKADKTSMANSVEARMPFMDHRLVEFLFATPPHLKLRGWRDKVLLRRYLADLLPGEPARRPKKPFYIPLERYFGTPALRSLTDECLSESSVRRRGYFAWPAVRAMIASIDRGDFLYGKQVFSLVMLELWHRIFIDREGGWTS